MQQAADVAEANEGSNKSVPEQVGVLTTADSQHILRLYFSLVHKPVPACNARKVCTLSGGQKEGHEGVHSFGRKTVSSCRSQARVMAGLKTKMKTDV